MNGEDRRKAIIDVLKKSDKAVSGESLAMKFDVSRQVIVQDIALIRAKDIDIYSTNRGYVISSKENEYTRVFKVYHTEEDAQNELNAIVDAGGWVKDVFVYHRVYGVLKAEMNIRSRRDIKEYMEEIHSGKSTLLMTITSGYHYHTIAASDEKTLEYIWDELQKLGFIAKLQDYEPVDFWNKEDN
jgi:transcriptional regulator of NAD metabolism